jgi:hypothetical protein
MEWLSVLRPIPRWVVLDASAFDSTSGQLLLVDRVTDSVQTIVSQGEGHRYSLKAVRFE